MKTYELTYIVSPQITSEEATAKGKEIEAAITSREGAVIKQTNPVAKALSYAIKKSASGFLGTMEFQLEPEKLAEVKTILEKDGKIVRHMIIIKEAVELKARRERKGRIKPTPKIEVEQKAEVVVADEKPASKIKEIKEKVELKDIEHELDEILGE